MNIVEEPAKQLAKRVDQSIQYFFQSLLWLFVIFIFTSRGFFLTILACTIVAVAALAVLGEDNGVKFENNAIDELLHKIIKIRRITVISTVTALGIITIDHLNNNRFSVNIFGFLILILFTIVSQYHFSMRDIEISKL